MTTRTTVLRLAPGLVVRSQQASTPFEIEPDHDLRAGLTLAGTFCPTFEARRISRASLFAQRCVPALAQLCGDAENDRRASTLVVRLAPQTRFEADLLLHRSTCSSLDLTHVADAQFIGRAMPGFAELRDLVLQHRLLPAASRTMHGALVYRWFVDPAGAETSLCLGTLALLRTVDAAGHAFGRVPMRLVLR